MRHDRVARVVTGSRRRVGWRGGPNGVIIQLGASGQQLLTNVGFSFLDGETVVRIRGYLQLFLTLATSIGDGFHGAFGIALANSNAITAGIASLKTPLADDDWDGWMYHTFFSCRAHSLTEADFNDSAVFNLHVDSKAMRKVNSDLQIYAAIDVTEIGAAELDGSFDSRMLVKLS